jgi:hypothetical protein
MLKLDLFISVIITYKKRIFHLKKETKYEAITLPGHSPFATINSQKGNAEPLRTRLKYARFVVLTVVPSSAPKIDAVSFSETSVMIYQIIMCHIPKGSILP